MTHEHQQHHQEQQYKQQHQGCIIHCQFASCQSNSCSFSLFHAYSRSVVLVNASPIAVETSSSSSSKSSSKSKFSSFFSSGSSKSSKPINNAYSVQDLSVSSSQSAHTSSPNLATASQHLQPTPSENSSATFDSNGKENSSSHRYVSSVKSSESTSRQLLQHPSPPITKSQSVSTLVSESISASGHHSPHQESELSAAKLALGSPSSSSRHSAHPQLPAKEHQHQHPSKSSQLKSVNMPLSAEETQLHCKWHSHFFFLRFTLSSLAIAFLFVLMLAVDVALSLPLSSSPCLCVCVCVCFPCQAVRPFCQALSDIFSAQVVDILIQSRRRRSEKVRCSEGGKEVTNYICAGATFIYYNLPFIYTCYRYSQKGTITDKGDKQSNAEKLCAFLGDRKQLVMLRNSPPRPSAFAYLWFA